MATARGITETKLYDHAGGHRALRHRARADPRLLRPEGRHERQHPRRPGDRRQDRVAAAAAVRRPRGRPRAHRRDLRRQAQGEPRPTTPTTRGSRRCWRRSQRDLAGRPRRRRRGRARARPLEAARGLPRVRAARPAAPPRGVPRRRRGRARAGGRDDDRARACARARSPTSAALPRRASSCSPSRAPRGRPRASCSPSTRPGASPSRPATRCSPARSTARPSSSRRSATRPVVAHDAKALGVVPPQPRPRHAARRLPARARAPRLPVPRAPRGARPGAPTSRTRSPPTRVLVRALPAWQREQIADRDLHAPHGRDRAAARAASCATWSAPGVRLNIERLARDHRARARRRSTTLELEIWDLAETEFVIGSPQQLGEILFDKLGLSKKRRGKTGFSTDARVLQAIRDEHEIIPKIERWRELNQLDKTYFSVLPQLADAEVAHPHDVPAGGRHHRPAGVDEPEHAERPDPHRARARDPRLLRGRAGQRPAQRRLLAGRAARARPHRRRAGAQGDLRARRGRPHRDRVAGLPHAARPARPSASARRRR